MMMMLDIYNTNGILGHQTNKSTSPTSAMIKCTVLIVEWTSCFGGRMIRDRVMA